MTILLQGAGLQALTSGGGLTPPDIASATLLLDLRANQLPLSDGDLVSTFTDKSGNGRDFTQTGAARPTYRAGGGLPYVEFPHGGGIYLDGQNWTALDNLDSFAVLAVTEFGIVTGFYNPLLYKYDGFNAVGWEADIDYYLVLIEPDYNAFIQIYQSAQTYPTGGQKHVVTHEKISNSELHLYIDGAEKGTLTSDSTVTTFANSVVVRIGTPSTDVDYGAMNIYAILMYQITDLVNWPTDRATIETWLAANT